MSFLDKLFRRDDKRGSEKPEPHEAQERVRIWIDDFDQRLQPDRLRLGPHETVGTAFPRIADEEEARLRASQEEPELRHLKLEALAKMRRELGLSSSQESSRPETESSESQTQASREATMNQENESRPDKATYEMVMGRMEDLKEVPLAHFMQLVDGWGTVVETLGQGARIHEKLREEYHRVCVTVSQVEKERELVALFHGSWEMVELFRQKLRELGLESELD